MTQMTLADALRLPAFRRARPVVLAGHAALDRPVRWAHATELTEVEQLIRSGDLMLTVGTGMPADDDHDGLARFAQTLADAGSVGLVVELGRRWTAELPDGWAQAFDERGVPLIVLTHEAQFATLTQAIGERVIDAQVAELRDAQRVHDTFTELSFTRSGPAEILDAVQRLSGQPVVLENAQHRPLDYVAGSEDMGGFLEGWQARSARVVIRPRTGWDEANGWLVTRLGTTEQTWGRLVIGSPERPQQRLIALVERAAAALALHRLHDRDRDNLVRRTHRELIAALQADPDADEVVRRCELAKFPTARRHFVGLVLRQRGTSRPDGDLNELAAAAVRAAHGVRVPALVSELDRDIRVLVSSAPGAADAAATRLAERVRAQHDVVIAAGRSVTERSGIERTLLEATQVADAVPPDDASGVAVHRLEDLHLRGLLALLGDDDRIRLFVERELAPLRDERGAHLYDALRALLLHPSSKTDAAASLHLSRAAFYDRLAKLEQTLGVDLDDPDVRVSLHVALVADEVSRGRRR